MSHTFIVSNNHIDGQINRGISIGGVGVLKFIPVLILEFLPNQISILMYHYKNEFSEGVADLFELLNHFKEHGGVVGIAEMDKLQFNVIHQALKSGYEYLESLPQKKREEWIENVAHFAPNAWDDTSHIYSGGPLKGEPSNLRYITRHVLELMEDDPRYDPEFKIDDYSKEEIEGRHLLKKKQ
jgi:hypothetical protein